MRAEQKKMIKLDPAGTISPSECAMYILSCHKVLWGWRLFAQPGPFNSRVWIMERQQPHPRPLCPEPQGLVGTAGEA